MGSLQGLLLLLFLTALVLGLWCISEGAGHTFRAGPLPSLPVTPAGRAGAQQLAGSNLGCNGQSLLSALPGVGRAQRHLLIPVCHPRKQTLSLPSCFASRRKWVWFPGHKQGSVSQERVINVRKDQGRSTAQLTWQEHKAGGGRCLLESLQEAKPAKWALQWLGQVVYMAVSPFKASFHFLSRASAVQTQLFGREGWGKHEFASSYKVWMKGRGSSRGNMRLCGSL